MTAFLIANMAPLMFAALVFFLLLGYPVAFALAANGIVFGLLGIELGLLSPSLFGTSPAYQKCRQKPHWSAKRHQNNGC